MKPFLFFSFCCALLACNTGDEHTQPQKAQPLKQTTPSLAAFSDSLKKLKLDAPTIVDSAVHLYDLLAPNDSTGADSAAVLLLSAVQDAVTNQNNRLQKDTAGYSALVNPADSNFTEKQKAVNSELRQNKMKIRSDGEGGVYLTPAYETILPTIKEKTSAAVDNYLDLMAKEDTMPTLLDGGIVIEMPELVDRLVLSEQLLTQKLPKHFETETERLNRFYTNALVNGADNTPSVENSSTMLNDSFKKGYDYLVAKYPSTKAAAKINVWMAVVASGDKKKMDAYRKTVQ